MSWHWSQVTTHRSHVWWPLTTIRKTVNNWSSFLTSSWVRCKQWSDFRISHRRLSKFFTTGPCLWCIRGLSGFQFCYLTVRSLIIGCKEEMLKHQQYSTRHTGSELILHQVDPTFWGNIQVWSWQSWEKITDPWITLTAFCWKDSSKHCTKTTAINRWLV